MVIKRIVLSITLLCVVLLSGCFDTRDYPRYEIEEIGKLQYIVTTPDGIPYAMLENQVWFPEILYGDDL